MALVLADRVKDTTTTTGQGTVTLSGTAPTGYQNFSIIGNGNTTYYTIAGGSQWEVGIGTYTSSGTTLSRDTVLSSSAGGTTKVTFSAGTKDVFVTLPAEVVPNYVYTKTTFTATASQTTFTVAYTVGYIDVYLNGVKLTTSEYTATNGTSVVLGTAAALNDIVETIAWSTFSATNTNIGVGTGTSLALGGATIGTNALAVTGTMQLNSALNYGGVALSNSVTGTGSMVLSTSPTLTTPVLGTPSSGTVTNLTGTASININGTVGATTAAAGKFTTLNATSLVDISAAGAGQIKFPASQNASADANTLDDYEEGTWTPGVSFGGGTTGITYSSQNGTYTRVGRQVTCWMYFAMSSKGSSTGNTKVTGLPFTISTANANYGIAAAAEVYDAALITGGLSINNFFTGSNVTTLDISTGNVTGTASILTQANFNNATNLTMTVNYNA